jgi:Peptidase M50B-like
VDPTQVPLSDTETVLIGLAVAAVVLPTASWRLVEHFNTMAHEGMHGAVGALSGGTVRSITMNEDAEGETRVGFRPTASTFRSLSSATWGRARSGSARRGSSSSGTSSWCSG